MAAASADALASTTKRATISGLTGSRPGLRSIRPRVLIAAYASSTASPASVTTGSQGSRGMPL